MSAESAVALLTAVNRARLLVALKPDSAAYPDLLRRAEEELAEYDFRRGYKPRYLVQPGSLYGELR